ncbi:MAG TPA: hypothetical protein VEU47_03640 [Candidatus Cybelea sp.]|nr:hypothetical protein [Candidatus Cybelea sp.]
MKMVSLESLIQALSPFGRVRERRQQRRIYEPRLELNIEGHAYSTQDWSLGGFRLAYFHRRPAAYEVIAGRILDVRSIRGGEFSAEVVRLEDSGEIGCRLLDITAATLMSMANLKSH